MLRKYRSLNLIRSRESFTNIYNKWDLYELRLFARSIRVPEAGDSDGDEMNPKAK
jgi:hypothetical protein